MHNPQHRKQCGGGQREVGCRGWGEVGKGRGKNGDILIVSTTKIKNKLKIKIK